MADFKITKKTSASLGMRILSVSILLLVIPLFLQSFFLYKQEYEEKLKSTRQDLKIIAEERALLLEEQIQTGWALLDAWSDLPQPGGERGLVQQIPTPNGVGRYFVFLNHGKQTIVVGKNDLGPCSWIIDFPLKILAIDLPRAYPVHIALMNQKGTLEWENFFLKEEESSLIQEKDLLEGTDFFVQVSASKDVIQGLHLSEYYFRFATLLFFVGGIGGVLVFLLAKRVSKPLNHLLKTMQKVKEGAFHARYRPDWLGFEINLLGLQFNQTLDDLFLQQELAQKEKMRREKLANEFHIGHQIQESLLPKKVPGLKGIELAARYFSAKEVNGDFYDFFELEDGKLLISVADVAGKGIEACLFSLGLRSILRSIASLKKDLSEIIQRANDLYLMDAHNASMFATVWAGIFDPKTKVFTYTSQGHLPAILVRDGAVTELSTQGIALGAQSVDTVYSDKIKLKKRDVLVFYTDGIVEAHGFQNELFGKKRLFSILEKIKEESSEKIADQILDAVRLFVGNGVQHDDMTLVVMRLI